MQTLYEQWILACESGGIPPFGIHTAAKIAATMLVYTPSEEFTHNPKAMADAAYIQRRYRLEGSETPDAEFARLLRVYVKDLEAKTTMKENGAYKPADWATEMYRDRYGIKILV